MKSFLYIVLCILAIAILSGCDTKPEEPEVESIPAENAPLMPEMEYTPIDNAFIAGTYLGKETSAITISKDTVFIESEKMIGYGYVSFCDIKGNLSVYLNNGQITSYVFGSTPFQEKDKFRESFNNVNKKIAELLGMEEIQPAFMGQMNNCDEMDSVFGGNGILKAEYIQNGRTISVSSCGVSEAATVIIECSKAK